MSSAPVRAHASLTAAANAGVSGRTPPSPWIGSTMTAAVLSVTASRIAAGLLAVDPLHAGQQRLERRAVVFVRRDRQRPDRPSVKRLFERHDLGPRLAERMPVAARELEARLDRLGAAVAEERALEARQAREPRGELALQRVEEQVRRVQQRLRLVGDGARRALRERDRGRSRRCPRAGRCTRAPRSRTGRRPCRARRLPADAGTSAGRAVLPASECRQSPSS